VSAFTRGELEAGWHEYERRRDEASRTADWNVFADGFTTDAEYVEHAYGTFVGRDAIRDWIVKVMAPFPTMTFPPDWVVVDETQGLIVFQCQNRLEHPTDPAGAPFQFPTWSLLRYAGDLLMSYEEDMYNPVEAAEVIRAWLEAGGQMATPEQVHMQKG
jgi:hypothetical protein